MWVLMELSSMFTRREVESEHSSDGCPTGFASSPAIWRAAWNLPQHRPLLRPAQPHALRTLSWNWSCCGARRLHPQRRASFIRPRPSPSSDMARLKTPSSPDRPCRGCSKELVGRQAWDDVSIVTSGNNG